MKYLLFLLSFSVFVVPLAASAQGGLVPCGNEISCELCHVVELVDNVLSFLVAVMISIAIIVFIWAGIKFTLSQGGQEHVTTARRIIASAIIGLIIVLAAWIIIDFGLRIIFGPEGGLTLWGSIECASSE